MAVLETNTLSPALQVLIGLELKNNEMQTEIDQLRKELNELKEKIMDGNDFSKYPVSLMAKDIAEILRISMVSAYQIIHQASFPKIMYGTKIIVPKTAFIKWFDSEAFSGVQYLKESGINGKKQKGSR